MSKYIDADRLRKELNKWRDVQPSTSGLPRKATYEAIGVIQTIDHVLYLLDSLQQEQPEGLHFTPLNRLIQKIPTKDWSDTVNNYAKKLRDCLITEGYRKDAEVLQGYISYMNGNNISMATMDEQEQQEVDLEKEIDGCWQNWLSPSNQKEVEGVLPKTEFAMYARHFAEWGRKQVLQEIYDGKVKPVDKITAAWLDDESKTKEDK